MFSYLVAWWLGRLFGAGSTAFWVSEGAVVFFISSSSMYRAGAVML